MPEKKIGSVVEYIQSIQAKYKAWGTKTFPWFRGEPASEHPLLPRLFREDHDENKLLQYFRMRAPTLERGNLPDRTGAIDLWLFWAQHMGLPTRLLDWSEGALVGLYFSVVEAEKGEGDPVVWMLDWCALNSISLPDDIEPVPNEPTITWLFPEEGINIYSENIRGAWELNRRGVSLPVAVYPSNYHIRMHSQRSCFTVHGKRREPLCDMVGQHVLKKFIIDEDKCGDLISELRLLGISESTVFPDLEGLARDLADKF